MVTQSLNFLWLNLDLPAPADPEDGSIRQPLPVKYINNVRKAGARHPKADIMLWVDSQRLTEKQMKYLKATIEEDRPNVFLKDLRSLPAYSREALYNSGEKLEAWRAVGGKASTIWRQVDCAKILISLQGNYEQSFFADMDRAHLNIDSARPQTMLKTCGLMVGSGKANKYALENQLWGFCPQRRDFFQRYYKRALEEAYQGENAWSCFTNMILTELMTKEQIALNQLCLKIKPDGSEAEHPGHAWRDGSGVKEEPDTISKEILDAVFSKPQATKESRAAARKLAIEQHEASRQVLSMAWFKAQLRRLPFAASLAPKPPTLGASQ